MSVTNMSVVAAVAQPSSSTGAASDDPVPAEVLGVIELFAGQLAKVTFPEIDAASLRRQADEVRAEAKLVAKAREALDAMGATLAGKLVALSETSARAVAYARIYSDAHPDRTALAAALAALSETRTPPAPALTANGKRRGRPPKHSAELFDVPSERSELDPG